VICLDSHSVAIQRILKALTQHVVESPLELQAASTLPYSLSERLAEQCWDGREAGMNLELNRLESFEKWPHTDYVHAQPPALAAAGFYYEPVSGRFQCQE
jgi:hypothetical protein